VEVFTFVVGRDSYRSAFLLKIKLTMVAKMRAPILFLLFYSIKLSFSWTQTGRKPAIKKSVPDNVRILILPGFGNESNDYFLEQAPEGSLVLSLQKCGWKEEQIRVVPLERSDWLKVFLRGVVNLDFWLSKAPPKVAFGWYLDRVAEQIKELTAEEEDSKVVLVCHSAGGWLARAALGFGGTSSSDEDSAQEKDVSFGVDLDRVLGVVTLGAPHTPPPPEIMDMTRGALRITHEEYPGAFHAPDIFYITVIGNAIRGVKQDRKTASESSNRAAGFAFNSYESVCGNGTAVGDGVVPVVSGHVDDAMQIELPGVFHSINAPSSWYGSDTIINTWHDTMMDQINEMNRQKQQGSSRVNPFEKFFQ
jgi:pimeloyl-ACP methyl ester carboxylesterase